MDSMEELKHLLARHKLYGSATVSPKGQVVIPANARQELGIEGGDTLLAFGDPYSRGVMLVKAEAMEQMLSMASEYMTELSKQVKRQRKGGR